MTPESHQRIFTYYAALDKVELQLNTRLGSNDHESLFSLGDIILKDNPKEKSFSTVCSFYDLDEELLKADFRVFKIIKEQDKSLNFTKATEVYESLCKDDNMLPKLAKMIRIYTVIPSTTATAERSFSGLRRTKTSFRNSMGQNMLNNYSILHLERSYSNEVIEKDIEVIMDTFGKVNYREK